MPFKKVDVSWKAACAMMSPPPKFLETMLGFKQKIDDGLVPKTAFPNIQDLLKLEHFDVEIQRKKSNAAAGLTDFIININVYNDINENVEPMRLMAQQATDDLATAIASKEASVHLLQTPTRFHSLAQSATISRSYGPARSDGATSHRFVWGPARSDGATSHRFVWGRMIRVHGAA